MGTYGLKVLIQLWEAEKLTNEQAIGQILQLLQIVELRLNDLERRQRAQEQSLSAPSCANGEKGYNI